MRMALKLSNEVISDDICLSKNVVSKAVKSLISKEYIDTWGKGKVREISIVDVEYFDNHAILIAPDLTVQEKVVLMYISLMISTWGYKKKELSDFNIISMKEATEIWWGKELSDKFHAEQENKINANKED